MAHVQRTILVVDDEAAQRELLGGYLESVGFHSRYAGSAEDALRQMATERPELVLLDIRLPGMSGIEALAEIHRKWSQVPVLLITAYADLRQAVEAVKGGATDYLSKPIDLDELRAAVTDAIGPTTDRNDAISTTEMTIPDGFVCNSSAMQHVLRTVAVVAPSNAPVLVTGESGVGKECVVEAIHASSRQAGGPLIAANCASFPETLIESELFGHAKGAFTGAATARRGLFRAADGGTLLLDEIGELPLNLQPKLLRVLETGQVTPVGSEATIKVDTRLVAATNRDLEADVRKGAFREDLFYRINVIELHVPPLRERHADILPLARQFAAEFAGAPVRLSPQALQCLLVHDWPGNVRELRNAIQRACLLCRGDVILPEHLPTKVASVGRVPGQASPSSRGRLSEVEQATIVATLNECDGNRTQAATKLGISRRALIYKLRAMEAESQATHETDT